MDLRRLLRVDTTHQIRAAIERLRTAVGVVQDAGGPLAHHAGLAIDQRGVPLRDRPKKRWNNTPRSIQMVNAVTLHVTGVPSFGVRKKDLARARAAHPNASEEALRARAQAVRFLATPYHAISALALVRNIDATVVSYHGHRSNARSLGYALDGMAASDYDESIEVARFGEWLGEQIGDGVPLRYLDAHRQYSSSRAGDPGAKVFLLLAPVARIHGLEVRPEYRQDTGKPLPRSWLAT